MFFLAAFEDLQGPFLTPIDPLKIKWFQEGTQETQSIIESWDTVWNKVLNPNFAQGGQISTHLLYKSLCDLGLLFAAGTLIFLTIYQFKLLLDNNFYEYFGNLLLPLVLVFLLANNGRMLSHYTFAIRNIINQLNTEILASAVNGINMQQAFRQVQQNVAINYATPHLIQQCQGLTGEQQYKCIEEEAKYIERFINDPEIEQSLQRNILRPWTGTGTEETEGTATETTGEGNIVEDTLTGLAAPFVILASEYAEATSFLALRAQQQGYQQLLEASMLLTALVGPLAAGGMLLFGGQSLFTWLTGFFSIGMAKISFNLIAGLAAIAELSASPSDPLPLATLLATYAPMLASAIALLGGMAVWQGITSSFMKTTELAGSVISRVL